jgi:manganese transport protein
MPGIFIIGYNVVTGETFIQGVKKHIHPPLAIGMIIPLSMVIFAALIGLLGIVANVLEAWSATFTVNGIGSIWWAAIITALLYCPLWIGNYGLFEKVLAILVGIMGIAFILTMCINFPHLSELAKGFIPMIPENAKGSDNSPLVIVAGMVGTTVSVFHMVRIYGWELKNKCFRIF